MRTPHGEVRVAWEVNDGKLHCDVTLPDGVEADVVLPGAAPQTVTESGTSSFSHTLTKGQQ